MSEILVLAEHRRGELREITFDLLAKGREIANKTGVPLTAVLLGYRGQDLAATLANYADRVLLVEHKALENFNSDAYQGLLSQMIAERNPLLTLIGHTSFGLDLAPSLAVQLNAALITDCVDVEVDGEDVLVLRPAYGGKVRARVALRNTRHRIITVQSGSAPKPTQAHPHGEVIGVVADIPADQPYKRFISYIDTSVGEIDISQGEIIVAVGRGIGDPKNISLVEDLANAIGGILACSRPVVDKKWLPKARQVGISGKTVQPKLYLAIGISGAFQHVAAIKGPGMIVAINKDPNAPIFRVADYGIVADLFKVVPILTEKIAKAKGKR